MSNALKLNDLDNVAVLPEFTKKGTQVTINGTNDKYVINEDRA